MPARCWSMMTGGCQMHKISSRKEALAGCELSTYECVGGCRDDGHRGPRTGSHRHRTARATCGTPRGWRLKRRAPERGPSPGGPGSTGTPRTSDDDMDVRPFLPATQRKERPVTAKPSEGPKKPKPRVTAPKDDT
ncbi:hypothetical protein MRX96_022612 [Rhipicephalus microplus]